MYGWSIDHTIFGDQVTSPCMVSLSKCQNLTYVNCAGSAVNNEAMKKFIESSPHKLKLIASVICKKLSKK